MSVLKYTGLVLMILVLSHIIQIKGVTVSKHVENTLNWISGTSTDQKTSQIKHKAEAIYPSSEFSPEDQKALNQVIQKAQKKK